jgi:hypothetical protein
MMRTIDDLISAARRAKAARLDADSWRGRRPTEGGVLGGSSSDGRNNLLLRLGLRAAYFDAGVPIWRKQSTMRQRVKRLLALRGLYGVSQKNAGAEQPQE